MHNATKLVLLVTVDDNVGYIVSLDIRNLEMAEIVFVTDLLDSFCALGRIQSACVCDQLELFRGDDVDAIFKLF